MKSIFDYESYRRYLLDRLKDLPKQGYGYSRKLAEHLRVHSTFVSQVLKNQKELSVDQGILVAEFFALGDLETQFFVSLVQWERASNPASRDFFKRQLTDLRNKSNEVKNRITFTTQLSKDQQATFYSHWTYPAIRQLSAIAEFQSLGALAKHLETSPAQLREVIEFLLQTGLCKDEGGKIKIGPASTYLEASSHWARVHHVAWRQKAIQNLQALKPSRGSELHYTSPLTLSEKDTLVVREKILEFIQRVNAVVDPSPSESAHCLSVDWFSF